MNRLRAFHCTFGLATLLLFLVSGAYLRYVAHPDQLTDRGHLLFVSRHIYILGGALVHLVLAAYVVPSSSRMAGRMQRLGSGLLAISSVLLVTAYVVEAMRGAGRTPASTFGLYAPFGGVIVHFVSTFVRGGR